MTDTPRQHPDPEIQYFNYKYRIRFVPPLSDIVVEAFEGDVHNLPPAGSPDIVVDYLLAHLIVQGALVEDWNVEGETFGLDDEDDEEDGET